MDTNKIKEREDKSDKLRMRVEETDKQWRRVETNCGF